MAMVAFFSKAINRLFSWFKSWFISRNDHTLKKIYTPEFLQTLRKENVALSESTQFMHEEALVKNGKSLKPFRHSSLYFAAFRSTPTLYRFNENLLTIKAADALLGKGISGKVKKHFSSAGPVAVKKVSIYTERNIQDCFAEINTLRALGRLKGYRMDHALNSVAYIVSEYYSGVNLAILINATRLSVNECVRLMKLMLNEVKQLHDLGYIHNDIKPENFMTHSLVSTRDEVKLVDFAFARPINQPISSGTPEYIAPEFFFDVRLPRTKASDIYSLGVTFSKMLKKTENPPEALEDLVSRMRATRSVLRPDIETIHSELQPETKLLYIISEPI